jgi:hypothetical protein
LIADVAMALSARQASARHDANSLKQLVPPLNIQCVCLLATDRKTT